MCYIPFEIEKTAKIHIFYKLSEIRNIYLTIVRKSYIIYSRKEIFGGDEAWHATFVENIFALRLARLMRGKG